MTKDEAQRRRWTSYEAVKILVVDDEAAIRELLLEFLHRERYQVVLTATEDDSLMVALEETPEVILRDAKMPGLNGIETCMALKAHEKTGHTPVLVTTALREMVLEAFDAGADDFVPRPFHLEELAIRIKSILRIQHLPDDLDRAAAYSRGIRSATSLPLPERFPKP